MKQRKISILTGAGISVASGLKTFRGEGGLWEGYDIMKVASIDGWHQDPELVLEFYNKRRAQLSEVEPNQAHIFCAMLERYFEVQVITQNVDDLHERGGSTKVLHLHGELKRVKSTLNNGFTQRWTGDLRIGNLCPDGGQLRPEIVWFGEAVPLLELAAKEVDQSDIVIIVGTSMQVYPAAGLIHYAGPSTEIYFIDPEPQLTYELRSMSNLRIISKTAVEGMKILYQHLVGEHL